MILCLKRTNGAPRAKFSGSKSIENLTPPARRPWGSNTIRFSPLYWVGGVSADELITSTANGGARARLALVQRAHGKERGRARRSCVAHLDTRYSARPHQGSHRWLCCEKIGSQHSTRASYFPIAAWLGRRLPQPRAERGRAHAPSSSPWLAESKLTRKI